MIYLDPNSPKVISAYKNHYESLVPVVSRRINNLPEGNLKRFLNQFKLRRILCDLPGNLETHHNDLINVVASFTVYEWDEYLRIKKNIPAIDRNPLQNTLVADCTAFKERINSIFKYTGSFAKKTSKYSAYHLANNLNIQTCTYCNRMYTKTVKNPSKIARPEFDHWFSKESYPLLALSFYNLIPSCHICNSSLKGSAKMNLTDYIHPYVDEKINYRFSYWIEALNNYKFDIKSPPNSKEEKTIKAFKLKEIYGTHKDEINDLVRLKKLYSIDYLLKMRKLLSSNNNKVSIEEMYRLAFGTHLNEENFHKRPLSKMKKDILEELNMTLK